MENSLQIILTVAISIYTLFAVLLGVWLGHKVTMKAFSHVQPSTKEMTKMMGQGNVTTEPDYIDEATNDLPAELSEDEEAHWREKFKEAGVPMELFESYSKNGRHPQEFFGYDVPYQNQGVEEEIEREA